MSLPHRQRALLSQLPPRLHRNTSEGEFQRTLQDCEFRTPKFAAGIWDIPNLEITFHFDQHPCACLGFLCLFFFYREGWSGFSSTGTVTWTLTLPTVNPRTPSVALISERIRPTPVTISGKWYHAGVKCLPLYPSVAVLQLCCLGFFTQVCQILQQKWSGVSNPYQGLRHSFGRHRTWKREQSRPFFS